MMRSHYCGQLNESLTARKSPFAVGFTAAATMVE